MELQGQIVPTSDAEWALLQGLYEVTGEAHDAGIPDDEIVMSLAFVAASIQAYGDEELPETPEGPVDEPREDCPECNEPIEDIKPFIGGECEVVPCGCYVEHLLVSGWIDG